MPVMVARRILLAQRRTNEAGDVWRLRVTGSDAFQVATGSDAFWGASRPSEAVVQLERSKKRKRESEGGRQRVGNPGPVLAHTDTIHITYNPNYRVAQLLITLISCIVVCKSSEIIENVIKYGP